MVVVNLVRTRNPIRRMLSGTWYKAVNEQGERLFWVPYTSVLFLANKMTVDDFLNLINDIDTETNIQLAFDRWNFGPGNKFDYEILRILLLVQEEKSYFNDPFLKEQVRYIQTPLDIMKNITAKVIIWTINAVASCLDFICDHTPENWMETFLGKVFEKILGKF